MVVKGRIDDLLQSLLVLLSIAYLGLLRNGDQLRIFPVLFALLPRFFVNTELRELVEEGFAGATVAAKREVKSEGALARVV